MARLRKCQEVTCIECKKVYSKRADTMTNWNGMCRLCSSLATINTKIKGIIRVPKKKCIDCGIQSKTIGKLKRCFSCSIPFRSKEHHYKWKGGVTSQSRYERTVFIKTVKPKVLKRDNYTCTKCGIYGGNLHVDHIKSWAEYPDKRFDKANCQTMCMSCHYQKTFNRPLPNGIIWGNNITKQYVIQ